MNENIELACRLQSFSWHAGLKVLRTRSARSGTISLIDTGNLTTVNELHDSG
jgi:hypothetical protein